MSNSGAGPTTGTVTVNDTVPAGLTATAILGSGWSCTGTAGPCSRSDPLAAGSSYPPITLTVNVDANANASVTNRATVSGGGESNTGNDIIDDVTTVNPNSGGTDLAIGKPAYQSSTICCQALSPDAYMAVDGITDGNFYDQSVTHTGSDPYSWWQVDLQSSKTIGSVVVWNRTDCCQERLSDYYVFISDTPFQTYDAPGPLVNRAGTWSSHQTTIPLPSTTIVTGNVAGRYVRVQLAGQNNLSLAEVEVFGPTSGGITGDFTIQASPSSQTVAPGQTARYTLSVIPIKGFNGTVNILVDSSSTAAQCANTTAMYIPAYVSAGTPVDVTITPGTSCSPSYPYYLYLRATAGSTTRPITLEIDTPSTQDFSITAQSSTQTLGSAGSAFYQLQLSRIGTFQGQVGLTVSIPNPPAGTSWSFVGPQTFSIDGAFPAQTVMLKVTSSSSIPNFTVTASSGTVSHVAPLSLVVQQGAPSAATLITPTDESNLTGASWVFQWTTGSGVDAGSPYQLDLGRAPGLNDLYTTNATSATSASVGVPNPPNDIYATLRSKIAGVSQPRSYHLHPPPPSPAPVITSVTGADGGPARLFAGVAGVLKIYGSHFTNTPGYLTFCQQGANLCIFPSATVPCTLEAATCSLVSFDTWTDGFIQARILLPVGAGLYSHWELIVAAFGALISTSLGDFEEEPAPTVAMKLEQVGATVISSDGNYSEDTTIRVTAVDATTGATITEFTGPVQIAEDGTAIYSQNVPPQTVLLTPSVNITAGGTTTFVARSLAGPSAAGLPPDAAKIKTTNYPVYHATNLPVLQWITSDLGPLNTIDPFAKGSVYDWVQARTRDIRAAASPPPPLLGDAAVATVLSSVNSYTIEHLTGAQGVTNQQRTAQTAITIDPYSNIMRINGQPVALCGQPAGKSFTGTLLHEARHAYQNTQAAIADNDQDADWLVRNRVPVAPADIFYDSLDTRNTCWDTNGNPVGPIGTIVPLAFHGDDTRDTDPFVYWAKEMDAVTFAGNH